DITVLDSESSDGTERIARDAGVRFHVRPFDDYATQRTFGLNLPHRHDWLLMLDADEVVTPQLWNEMQRRVAEGSGHALFRMRRKDFFLGRWIRRSSGYPTWFGRLMRRGKVEIRRAINEEYVPDGTVGYLDHHLHHFPFNKGIAAWVDKHNRYSDMEAAILSSEKRPRLTDLFSSDPVERRRQLKRLVYRTPGRPLLMFFGLYIVRGGILDGRPGLYFSMLRAFYELLIDIKAREAASTSQDQ
ncbi:MAG: glycosyltransferase family 2 protein, partial [Myxococcota bacterium]